MTVSQITEQYAAIDQTDVNLFYTAQNTKEKKWKEIKELRRLRLNDCHEHNKFNYYDEKTQRYTVIRLYM